MTDPIERQKLGWQRMFRDCVKANWRLREENLDLHTKLEKLRNDVIEECATLMQRWGEQASPSTSGRVNSAQEIVCRNAANAIRALAKTSDDRP